MGKLSEEPQGANAIQTWHHCHGVFLQVLQSLCHLYKPLQIWVLSRAQGLWRGPALYCAPFQLSVTTSPVESFSLKKLFNHEEENRELNTDNTGSWFCFNHVCGLPLHQATYLGILSETLFVGMVKCECKMEGGTLHPSAYFVGMHHPSSGITWFHSQVLDAGRKRRSWEGKKKGNGVWEQTETRLENLVGWGLPEILYLYRQSCPSLETLMEACWQASVEAFRLHRGAVAYALLDFVKHMLDKEQLKVG